MRAGVLCLLRPLRPSVSVNGTPWRSLDPCSKMSRFHSVRCSFVRLGDSLPANAVALRDAHVLVGVHGGLGEGCCGGGLRWSGGPEGGLPVAGMGCTGGGGALNFPGMLRPAAVAATLRSANNWRGSCCHGNAALRHATAAHSRVYATQPKAAWLPVPRTHFTPSTTLHLLPLACRPQSGQRTAHAPRQRRAGAPAPQPDRLLARTPGPGPPPAAALEPGRSALLVHQVGG